MASVPRNVSDWLVTPAPLNTEKHGGRTIFSGDNSIVERRQPDDYIGGCVCYSSHRLPLGQVWQITLLNTTRKWYGGLGEWMCTLLPVMYTLPESPFLLILFPSSSSCLTTQAISCTCISYNQLHIKCINKIVTIDMNGI